jgi:hypothetical protein
MADDGFSLEDIQGWHTPKQVEDLLPDHWSPSLRRTEIAHRMQAGTIRVGALRMVSETGEHHGVIIKPAAWAKWGFLAQDGSAEGFWQGASFQKFMAAGRGFNDQHLVRFFGVRLHRGDVSAMFVELGLHVAPTSPQGRLAAAVTSISKAPAPIGNLGRASPDPPRAASAPPPPKRGARATAAIRKEPVQDQQVQLWYAALPAAQQARGVLPLWAAANEYFAPRWVMRKQVEPFGKGRNPGRPRKD